MAKVLNTPKRKCDVIFNGPIPELRFLNGPVYGCRITTTEIERLVANGKKVYEINPANPNEKVLLTIASCKNSPFQDKEAVAVEPPVAPESVNQNVVGPAVEEPEVNENPEQVEESVVETPVAEEPKPQVNNIPSYQQFNNKKDKKNKHKHDNQNGNPQFNAQNVNAQNSVEEKATEITEPAIEAGEEKKEEVATEVSVTTADAVM